MSVDIDLVGAGGYIREGRAVGEGFRLLMDDPDDPDGNVRWYRVDGGDLERVTREIASGRHKVHDWQRRAVRAKTISPRVLDAVLQIAAFGRVVY